MPKIGGNTIEECMEICMSDPKLREEVKDGDKRREMCYAACMSSLDGEQVEINIAELIKKYK